MKFIIKAKPEDFVVEELAELPLADTGEYAVFRLTKRGWNTVDVVRRLSRQMRLPLRAFGYGGRKDRHAQTCQYITVKEKGGGSSFGVIARAKPEAIISKNNGLKIASSGIGGKRGLLRKDVSASGYSLEFVGRMAHAMSPRFIRGNKFLITVRDLSAGAVQRALSRIPEVSGQGFPNYFDDQRFGSYDTVQGFLGEKVLKGHFNGALKIYLTKEQVSDKPADRARKRIFYTHWGEWSRCRAAAVTSYEKEVFDYLAAHPKGFLDILRRIPHEEITVYFSAYQSFLWNEILRAYILHMGFEKVRRYAGIAGEYVFPLLDEGHERVMRGCAIPLPGRKAVFDDSLVKDLYTRVLEARGIRQALFNNLKLRQAFFQSLSRRALVQPEKLRFQAMDDDIYKGRQKIVFDFELPRGSFATMLLKCLFAG